MMRSLLLLFTVTAVLGSAVWAYRQNYQTRAVLDQIEDIEREINALESRRAVLEAEWAYLNRPDRLRELINAPQVFPHLDLGPFLPQQFVRLSDLPYRSEAGLNAVRLAERAP